MTEQEMQKRIEFLESRLNEIKLQYAEIQIELEATKEQLRQSYVVIQALNRQLALRP